MRIVANVWNWGGSGFVVAALLAGCGTESRPLAEINLNETTVADTTEMSAGLPLLAVPGPDDAKSKGKVTRASATSKSAPTLLPKGLFGKKVQPESAPENEPAGQPTLEKGSPQWLLREIQLMSKKLL